MVKISSEENSTWRRHMCHHSLETLTNVNVFRNVIHPHLALAQKPGFSKSFKKIFERPSKTLSSVWSYIKAPPAKSVLATICCGLSLIGMLLEYYCTLGGIVQVSLHCYPIRPSGDNRTRPAGGRNLNWARGASCTRLHCVAGKKTWHRERIVDFRDFLLGWKSICCCCNISTGSPLLCSGIPGSLLPKSDLCSWDLSVTGTASNPYPRFWH